MAGQTGRSGIMCPFFLSTSGIAINCEAPHPDALHVQTLFCNGATFRFHLYEYCSTQTYKFCEIYRMVMDAKYTG